MKKQSIYLISNDWHLKQNNIPDIKNLIKQKCELAVKLGIKNLIVLGDIFDSRISQRQEVLTAFYDILNVINNFSLKLIVIPGNHDKTVYKDKDSFLQPFKYHPAIELVTEYKYIPEYDIHLIPFFEEQIWLNIFNNIQDKSGCLMSHIAVNGSINNDHSEVESKIKVSLFKDFNKVLLGHYHNYHQVGKNIYHLPSIQQNNFGEDDNKGFTVLYDDLTFEIHNSNFVKYKKIKIDVDEQDLSSTLLKVEELKNDNVKLRVEFTGTEANVKSLNKEIFFDSGIDVKVKVKEVDDNINFSEKTEIVKYNNEQILNEFGEFCKQENLDLQFGLKYLSQKLK